MDTLSWLFSSVIQKIGRFLLFLGGPEIFPLGVHPTTSFGDQGWWYFAELLDGDQRKGGEKTR